MNCILKTRSYDDCEAEPDEDTKDFEIDNEECEAKLSELFDEQIAPEVIAQYGENDEPAMNEAFNNWSDMLCKDRAICAHAYNTFCYVGKYATE